MGGGELNGFGSHDCVYSGTSRTITTRGAYRWEVVGTLFSCVEFAPRDTSIVIEILCQRLCDIYSALQKFSGLRSPHFSICNLNVLRLSRNRCVLRLSRNRGIQITTNSEFTKPHRFCLYIAPRPRQGLYIATFQTNSMYTARGNVKECNENSLCVMDFID
jgi:hypothetical protein